MRKYQKYTQPRGIDLIKRKGININKNTIGIISLKHIRATESLIKSLKQDLNNLCLPSPLGGGRHGKISKFFHIFYKLPNFNKILTHKGILVRMGKGKGKIISKYLILSPYQVLFFLKFKQSLPNLSPKNFSKFLLKYPFLGLSFNFD